MTQEDWEFLMDSGYSSSTPQPFSFPLWDLPWLFLTESYMGIPELALIRAEEEL